MPWHPFGTELKCCRFGKSLRDDDCGRNAPLFQGDRVVHTAQRARASAADRSDGHLHLLRHGPNDGLGSRLGIVFLAPHHHTGDPVTHL